MTKQEYIQMMQEHYEHNWHYVLFSYVVCPSNEIEGWSLVEKDDCQETEVRLQFLENLVMKQKEDIEKFKNSVATVSDWLTFKAWTNPGS